MNMLEKLRMQKGTSVLTIAIGFLLLIYMVLVEDEPGAIPLLLIISGSVWYFITRARTQSHHN
jgi:hypothetical protein